MPAFVLAVAAAVGCSSASTGSAGSNGLAHDTSPTAPPAASNASNQEQQQDAPGRSSLAFSPACGKKGVRVVLRLGLTHEGHAPSCVRPTDFEVRFANAPPARITQIGPTSDGYCALDVLVPEEAASGPVMVNAPSDVFESTADFHVPCDEADAGSDAPPPTDLDAASADET